MPIEVDVVSRVKRLYRTDKATMVIIPGTEGEMGVLPNHTPLLTTLQYGELRIIEGENVTAFLVYGGVVEVRPDKVIVLADGAESVYDLNLDEIEAARERARQLMAENPSEELREQYLHELRRAEIAAKVQGRIAQRGQQIRTVEDRD